LAAGHFRLQ
jgi:hypothetical protein